MRKDNFITCLPDTSLGELLSCERQQRSILELRILCQILAEAGRMAMIKHEDQSWDNLNKAATRD